MSKTSKKTAFIAAFQQLPADISRKEALVLLSASCGLSIAGASTYYANVKSGMWALPVVEVTVAPTAQPDLESMTSAELVALYNSKVGTDKAIVKFRDRATGLKRVAALLN